MMPLYEERKEVELYTDGACSGNPGIGGWAAILTYRGMSKEISGGALETTNNIMELEAVIQGLSKLKESCVVQVYSDSAYVVNAFDMGWIYNWRKNNWKTADKKPVKNVESWQKLYSLCREHKVVFNKVKGHSDNVKNNRCDELARSEIKKLQCI